MPEMQAALLSPRRMLRWMWMVEGDSSDLYAWSGVHTINYGGHDWVGVGHVASMETLRKVEGLEHVEQKLSLSGLDPSALTELDSSVRGRVAKVWLGALNDFGQIIASPLLLQQLEQDSLSWERSADDKVTLALRAFEALPFVRRATGKKWSYESQQEAFSGDVGFKYNTTIALTGAPIDWRVG